MLLAVKDMEAKGAPPVQADASTHHSALAAVATKTALHAVWSLCSRLGAAGAGCVGHAAAGDAARATPDCLLLFGAAHARPEVLVSDVLHGLHLLLVGNAPACAN